MCTGGGSSPPPSPPPPPPPAPAAPPVVLASASDAAQSDVAKISRLKGRAGLRIDQTLNATPLSGGATGGLNIPN